LQKEAVAFLNKEVFTTPKWLLDDKILNKISNPGRMGGVVTVQSGVLDALMNDRVLNTLNMAEARYGKGKTYGMVEYLNDLKAGVWSEVKDKKPIDAYRRSLQKSYVANIFAGIREA